jgi:hypothetical protein
MPGSAIRIALGAIVLLLASTPAAIAQLVTPKVGLLIVYGNAHLGVFPYSNYKDFDEDSLVFLTTRSGWT